MNEVISLDKVALPWVVDVKGISRDRERGTLRKRLNCTSEEDLVRYQQQRKLHSAASVCQYGAPYGLVEVVIITLGAPVTQKAR